MQPKRQDFQDIKVLTTDVTAGSLLCGCFHVLLQRKMRRIRTCKAFDANFKLVASISNNLFCYPIDVKISQRHGLILVANNQKREIIVLDLETRNFKYNIPLDVEPMSMALDDDHVVVSGENQVLMYNILSGVRMWSYGQRKDRRELQNPIGLLVDCERIIVCDSYNNRLVSLSLAGQLLEMWGTIEDLECPYAVAIDGRGDIILVEAFRGSFKIVSNNFTKCEIVNVSEQAQATAVSLVVDAMTQHVIVCDVYMNEIRVISRTGRIINRFGAKGSACHQFQSPRGLSISGGCLYVADSNNHRIQVFT